MNGWQKQDTKTLLPDKVLAEMASENQSDFRYAALNRLT
jgi:hypothetical protein